MAEPHTDAQQVQAEQEGEQLGKAKREHCKPFGMSAAYGKTKDVARHSDDHCAKRVGPQQWQDGTVVSYLHMYMVHGYAADSRGKDRPTEHRLEGRNGRMCMRYMV